MTKAICCPKGHVNVRETGSTSMSSAGGSIRVNGTKFPLQAVNITTHYYVCKTCGVTFKRIEQSVKRQ